MEVLSCSAHDLNDILAYMVVVFIFASIADSLPCPYVYLS